MQNQMEIFHDKNISLDQWEDICYIIKGVGTTQWKTMGPSTLHPPPKPIPY